LDIEDLIGKEGCGNQTAVPVPTDSVPPPLEPAIGSTAGLPGI